MLLPGATTLPRGMLVQRPVGDAHGHHRPVEGLVGHPVGLRAVQQREATIADRRDVIPAALTGIVYQRLLPRIGGGLVAAFEVLVANTAIRNLIKEGKPHQLRNALVTGHREGMVTFEQSLSALIVSGQVSYEDAVARSLYPQDIDPRPRSVPA